MSRALDVVVATYNNPDIEQRCVDSLLAPGGLPLRSRVVVVDDHSDLPVRPALRAWDVWARQPSRRGPHAAWNAGARLSRPGADLAFVGSDVVVPPGVMRILHDYLEQNPDVALVAAADWKLSPDTVPASDTGLLPESIPGFESCCVVRREAWDRLGGFDEQFFVTFGDSDWNQRAEDAGMRRVRLPGVFVYHGCSVTRKRIGVREDLRMDRDDHCRFLEKWQFRPDVCARHPMADERTALAAKAHFWRIEGEQ